MNKPEWIIESCVIIKNTPDYDPDNAVCHCEKCNAPLFAQVWTILNTIDNRLWRVGSTCVKKLTGQTIGQLRAGKASFDGAMATEDEEKRMTARRIQFFQLHRVEMEWLDSHIERIHAVGERLIQEAKGTDKFPYLPSAEFWESLREQSNTKGALTENQLNTLRREMGLNHDAKLPEKKSKGVFSGTIESAKELPTFDGKGFKVRVTLRSDDNTLIILDINSGTAFEGDINKALGVPMVSSYGGGRPYDIINRLKNFVGLEVKATVKANAALGGKTYLTRPSLVAVKA